MRDETLLGLLGLDTRVPGVRVTAYKSVNAAVLRAEQRTGGWAAPRLSQRVRSSLQHGLQGFATRFRPGISDSQEVRGHQNEPKNAEGAAVPKIR